ncbi:MAG: hypothetical protein V3U26_03920 [Dehalococcoidia bacterium]
MSPDALARLEEQLSQKGEEGAAILQSLVTAMKDALATSLHDVFVLGAIMMGIAVLVIFFLKEIPLRKAHELSQT